MRLALPLQSPQRRGPAVESLIQELLMELTLDEKLGLVHANSKFTLAAIPRLGLGEFTMSDGPHGVRREVARDTWEYVDGADDKATYLPTGTAQAATFNRAALAKAGAVLGAEARERGKDVILGPGFNMLRYPLCGRNFEYYSEDPYHAGELAVAAVQAIQEQDTAACVKHYACNSQELNRERVNARIDERALREIYLPAFEAAIKRGGSLTVMGAYNQVRGQQACHHKYLVCDILKREWGFAGVFLSDWAGATNLHEAVHFGLDIEMGTNTSFDEYFLANPYKRAIQRGVYGLEQLNDKVSRVLRVMFAVGIFDPGRKAGARSTPAHQQAALEIAEEAVVLLKNEGQLLPFSRGIRTLAVIGDNADRRHAEGGNSSAVLPPYEVTPLEGLRQLLGSSVELIHARGYPEQVFPFESIPTSQLGTVDQGSGIKGWRKRYYASRDLSGPALLDAYDDSVDVHFSEGNVPSGILCNQMSAEYQAELIAPSSGDYTFGILSDGVVKLTVGEAVLVDERKEDELRLLEGSVRLEKGQAYPLRIEYRVWDLARHLKFGWRPEGAPLHAGSGSLKEEAVEAARRADAVVIFGGLNHFHDLEGRDRESYALPGGQDELIHAVVQANPSTAVVVIGGSPAAMPWLEQVKAVLWGWYGGMEGGNALARVLFGEVNPSGKLPFTIPKAFEDNPVTALDDYKAEVNDYPESVLMGYRWFDAKGIEPLFPFGHGESYTRFELSKLEVQVREHGARVTLQVTNTGARPGAEVVQLYVEDVEASELRPPRELKGFEKVFLDPGETREVAFELDARAFAFWSERTGSWVVEPGAFLLHVGTSSRQLPLVSEILLGSRLEISARGHAF